MKNFFKSFQSDAQQAVPVNKRLSLIRSFVETGDERCPLAGIWSRLSEMDSLADDEPGLARPVRGVFLFGAPAWRAFYFLITVFCYRTA